MAQKKMELMYKDLHVNYLEIAESVLKDTYLESRFLPDINIDFSTKSMFPAPAE